MKAFLCRCLPLLLLFALIFTALAACATEPGGRKRRLRSGRRKLRRRIGG